jgi:nucleoside-diphosphate-sugar epimerase
LIAISGVSGLIGQHLVQHLDQINVKWRGVSLVSARDLEDVARISQNLQDSGVDTLIHLGWPLKQIEDYRTSIENFRASLVAGNLAVELHRAGIKCFLTGTAAEFDTQPSLYGQAKILLRTFLNPLIESGQIGWLRPWYVYDQKVWPSYLREASGGLTPVIFDNRPLFYVDIGDVVDGIVAAYLNSLGGEIDIALEAPFRPSDLLSALQLPYLVQQAGPEESSLSKPKLETLLSVGWNPHRTKALLSGGAPNN